MKFKHVKHLYPNIEFVKPVGNKAPVPKMYTISSITEEQAVEIFNLIWNTSMVLSTFTDVYKTVESYNSVGFKGKDSRVDKDDEYSDIGLTIDKDRGVELSFGGQKMMVDQFVTTKYLLDHNIDLFDLIDSTNVVDADLTL